MIKKIMISQPKPASEKSPYYDLEKEFGIAPERLQTDGMGEQQPVSSNDKPENKAKNRRVEFIKL